jgi:glutamyl-tRNA synthetase
MHLPLILNPSGKGKLSKRDSEKMGIPVFPLSWKKGNIGYKEKGFLPNALINYLALLGWNDNTEKEIYSLQELEKIFDFKKIQKSAAKFDYEKAKWINHNHIKALSSKTLLKISNNYLENLFNLFNQEEILDIINLVKNRLTLISDLKKETLFFAKNPDYNNMNDKIAKNNDSIIILKELKKTFSSSEGFDELKDKIITYGSQNNIKLGFLMQLLRTAIVGELSGPDLFSIIKLIGKSVTLSRIENLISKLNL